MLVVVVGRSFHCINNKDAYDGQNKLSSSFNYKSTRWNNVSNVPSNCLRSGMGLISLWLIETEVRDLSHMGAIPFIKYVHIANRQMLRPLR